LASCGDPLAGGLNLMPYFDGERTPNLPGATGSLTGMSRASLTRENLARSSVLAVMNSLADAAEALSEVSRPAQRALLIGGGARSASLRAVAPELLGIDVDVLEAGEYVALGAARQAVWSATGELPAFERRIETRLSPSGAGWGAQSRNLYATERTRLYGV
ncbi:MAG: FGGY-family carbohydrate kinase, partial [Arthrobacter sp.]